MIKKPSIYREISLESISKNIRLSLIDIEKRINIEAEKGNFEVAIKDKYSNEIANCIIEYLRNLGFKVYLVNPLSNMQEYEGITIYWGL